MWVSPRCFLDCLTIRMFCVFFWMLHNYNRLLKQLELLWSEDKKIWSSPSFIAVKEDSLYSWFVVCVCVIALFFVPRAAPCAKRRNLPTASAQDAINGCAAPVQRSTDTARSLENASCLYPWKAAQVLGTRWGFLPSRITYSVAKGAVTGSVWLRANKRLCGFSPTFPPTSLSLPQSALRIIGEKAWMFVFHRIFSTCLSTLWSDGTGLGGLQMALPFWYFRPNLGHFIEKAMTKQFLWIWTRCVRESQTAEGCGHYRMFLS